jgi:hypothetical protein
MQPDADDVRLIVSPAITPHQLFAFYVENDICEKGFGEEVACRVLDHSDLIVGAFEGDKLVGLVRAMFDGLSAQIVEFCLATKYQGEGLQFANGSLIERDPTGLGKRLGEMAVKELLAMGAFFISATQVLAGVEEEFYRSLGFGLNEGSLEYIVDQRPYVTGQDSG